MEAFWVITNKNFGAEINAVYKSSNKISNFSG
jgi:hypothetical protein